jgi:hypothetical protein
MNRAKTSCNSATAQKIAAIRFPYPYLVSGRIAALAGGAPARDEGLTRPAVHRLRLSSAGRPSNTWKRLIIEMIALSCDMSQTLEI